MYLKVKTNVKIKDKKLQQLPWYFVIGDQQTGKTSFIKNTGLYFVNPEQFSIRACDCTEQFPQYSWWFSEQAVLIESNDNFSEAEQPSYNRLLKFAKNIRKRKKITGIIIMLSLPDLMLNSNQKRQTLTQKIAKIIDEIYSHVKAPIPVYLAVNKCDLIDGFLAFFNDVTKEELKQAWGISIPLASSLELNAARQFYNQAYNNLIVNLNQRIIWSLAQDNTLRGRELIYQFSQQMQLLRKPLEDVISELFLATTMQQALQLRGLYFMSCDQSQGNPFNYIAQAISKNHQLIQPTFQHKKYSGESYFVRDLFLKNIYPEGQLPEYNPKKLKYKKYLYNAVYYGCPLFLLTALFIMHKGCMENENQLKKVKENLQQVNVQMQQLNRNDGNIAVVLPVLDTLRTAKDYLKPKNHAMHTLLMSYIINYKLNAAYQRGLKLLFLPRIAKALEFELQEGINDPDLLYATFKGYLVFDNKSHVSAKALATPMAYIWGRHYDAITTQKLTDYLNNAQQQSINKLPIDNTLIINIRMALQQMVVAQRAYGLLQLSSTIKHTGALNIAKEVGANYKDVYLEKGSPIIIPALYTKTGNEMIFKPEYHQVIKEVMHDNQEVGLADITTQQNDKETDKAVWELYQEDYAKAWITTLNTIEIKPFVSFSEANTALTALSRPDSPLTKVLNLVAQNTKQIAALRKLNTFTQQKNSKDINKAIEDLRQYITTLQTASDPQQASFDAAVAILHGSETPIQRLDKLAKTAPQPLQGWLSAIVNHCWEVIVYNAQLKMNNLWQLSVLNDYTSNIQGRYPLDAQANAQITIDNFNHFFGNNGTMDIYFKQYIKPFINTTVTPWELYTVDNHSIELPLYIVQLFERTDSIRATYFPPDTTQAQFQFSLKPLSLDGKAANSLLVLGDKRIDYSHGPQETTVLNWPMSSNDQSSQIVISDFDGVQYTYAATGAWALFKLLSYGSLMPTDNNGTYIYSVNLQGYHATYEVSGSSNPNLFKLSNLKGLTLPSSLTMAQVSKESANG